MIQSFEEIYMYILQYIYNTAVSELDFVWGHDSNFLQRNLG